MKRDIRVIKNILLFASGVLAVYLLSLLSSLLIPLALALFMAMLVQPGLSWLGKKGLPFLLSVLLILIPSFGVLALFGTLIYRTGKQLYAEKNGLLLQIEDKLVHVLDWLNSLTGLEITEKDVTSEMEALFDVDWFINSSSKLADTLGSVTGSLGSFTGLSFMTLIYFIVLLGGIMKYEQYLKYLSEGNAQSVLAENFEKVKKSVVTYTKIKLLVSFFTGLGYYLVCLAFGIKFALFWGFLAFLLNFIPTFGSIIATLPPLCLGLIQLDSLSSLGLLLVTLFVVQMIMGNVVEPKLMGERLSLNTITVLVGLVFWGYVWGITGMILSMPLLVLTKIILSQIPDAQLFVRLMGSAPEPSAANQP